MVEIYNLSKSYAHSGINAVENLTMNLEGGEIYGFLGPNGAGKSTTIKCITGILPFNEGSVKICGTDIRENPLAAKRHIGFVADEHILFEALTGLQYINFIADVFGVSEEDRKSRTELYAKRFDMTDNLKNKISSYSHGMKQKISIIAALVHEPDVWILDEPMTGLDPKSMHELKQLMTEYAQKGKVVFFSSHVLDVVEKICTKIAIINKGKLITVCDIKELQEKRSEMSLEEFFLALTGVKESEGENGD